MKGEMRIEMSTFEMDGEAYETDKETLSVLRSIVPSAKDTGDASAVAAVMELGLMNGRIKRMAIAHGLRRAG